MVIPKLLYKYIGYQYKKYGEQEDENGTESGF